MGDSMGDLIDFSPILTLQTTSRPFQKWDLLEPGQRKTSTSSIPSSRSGSVHPASPIPLDDRENKKKDRNLLGLAIGSPSTSSSANPLVTASPSKSLQGLLSPQHVSGRNVPLPPSPMVRQVSIDTDTQSVISAQSDETTQSKLSAAAAPFESTPKSNRLAVVRKSDPPVFFPSNPSPVSSHQSHDDWQGEPDVQPDQMDPSFFAPGYGGHSTGNMYDHVHSPPKVPPPFHQMAPTRDIKITTPVSKKVKLPTPSEAGERVDRPTTPVTPGPESKFVSIESSPVSSRAMRDRQEDESSSASSPTMSLADLNFGSSAEPGHDADVLEEGEIKDEEASAMALPTVESQPVNIDGITAQFRSVSLSTITDSDAGGSDHSEEDTHHDEVATSDDGVPFRDEYANSHDGRLSPAHTVKIEQPHSTPPPNEIDQTPSATQGDSDIGEDTTLVSPYGLLDPMDTLAEIDELERSWLHYREGYAAFSGSIDECLVRVKKDMSLLLDQQAHDTSASVDPTSEMRIANARYLAQQSQLRMTRQKLESARDEIERLEHQVRSLENSNESAATQARVKEDEKAELEAKLKKWEQRNQVLAGRYLQLREEYEVLSNRRKGDIDEPYVVVLLDGDGRMFEPDLLRQGHKGGKSCKDLWRETIAESAGARMAEKLIGKLGKLYTELDIGTVTPKFILQLFTDVKRASGELITAGYIRDQVDFSNFLAGFQSFSGLTSVILVKDNSGGEEEYLPGVAICERAKFYAGLRDCAMVVLGAGWNKPYRRCIEELRLGGHGSKIHALRSTSRPETDPFRSLGDDRVLYVDHLFSTSIKDWIALLKGTSEASHERKRSLDPVSSATMTESSRSSVSTATTITRPRSPRAPADAPVRVRGRTADRSKTLFSPPDSPPPSRAQMHPAWGLNIRGTSTRDVSPPRRAAPRGGSLLDQMSQSSRASSPGSDRTEVPSQNGTHGTLEIPIDPEEVSIGGSPPSSDSDDPSVPVPHSARKYVRRPIPFQEAGDDDESVSEYSSVSAASTTLTSSVAPARRSSYRMPNRYPPSVSGRAGPPVSGSNAITPAKAAGKGSLLSRMTSDTPQQQPEARSSWAARMGLPIPTDEGKRVASGQSSRKRASEYMYLAKLDPSPCHNLYLRGKCDRQYHGCDFGHAYQLNGQHIEVLAILAKGLRCKMIDSMCNGREEDCIYSHRCPQGRDCTYGRKCWFMDGDRHLD